MFPLSSQIPTRPRRFRTASLNRSIAETARLPGPHRHGPRWTWAESPCAMRLEKRLCVQVAAGCGLFADWPARCRIAAFEALQAAGEVRDEFRRKRLDASVRRILQAKARLGLNTSRLVDVNCHQTKNSAAPSGRKKAQEISDRGVTAAARYAAPFCRSMEQNRRERCCWRFTPIRNRIRGEDLERELRSRFDSVCDAASGHAFCECFHFETTAAGFLRRCDSCVFLCALSDRKGNVDVPAEQGRARRTNLQNGQAGNHFGVRKSVFD